MSDLFLPIALALFAWVTVNRAALGKVLGAPVCKGGHCMAKHAPAHAMLAAPYR